MPTTKLIATIKRGDCDSPNDQFFIPKDFKIIRDLWQKQNPECFKLIRKYITALFISSNMIETPSWFDADEVDELQAIELDITGLTFNDNDLPIVSAVALFEIPTTHVISNIELEKWQEENDEYLDNAVSFEWILEPKDEQDITSSNCISIYDELRVEIFEQ
jgi:hypothetical protein